MSNHRHDHSAPAAPADPRFVRHCDVAVVGGSAAGLAAALQLARQRRSVIVVDSGEPRNASAEHMHSFLGRDGENPAQLLDDGRAEVRGYGVEVLTGSAQQVNRDGERFVVTLAEGTTLVPRRIVVATGLVDELPAVGGIENHWGRAVFHCPFCHGFEVRDQRLIHLVTHPFGLHVAPLMRQLSDHLIVLVADHIKVPEPEVQALAQAGVDVRVAPSAQRVLTCADGHFAGVELTDGSRVDGDAVLVSPRFHPRSEPFAGLGLRPTAHPSGMGEVIEVDAMGATAIEGVYAAGSITEPGMQVLMAAAHGSRVGGAVAMSLAADDLGAGSSHAAADWDARYSGERIWSGNPNGSLVAEAAGLPAGRALDVGAGEGGDALWLAERGWDVTASDISARALERIRAEAQRRDVSVTCLAADASSRNPYAQSAFDLVLAAYAVIPRTPDLRGLHNVIGAVRPGGTLIILSHDIEAMRARPHASFDTDAHIGIDDIAAALDQSPEWTIEVNEKRSRPAGAASAAQHPDDRVLRARRH